MKFPFLLFPFLLSSFFLFAQATRNDVVINEIMCDPSPAVLSVGGLPETEFIELKNVSPRPINLTGWKISDATTTATISVNFILQPDSFVIVCSNSAVTPLSVFGKTLGVSNYPSLDNDGETIHIRSKEGRLIHAVEYKKSWYRNAVKSEGGWTLEMIDTGNPCSGYSNWKASMHERGGTPGKRNSINGTNSDVHPPALIKAYAPDSLTVVLAFDEPLDSLTAITTSNFSIDALIGAPHSAEAVAPLFNTVSLRLKSALQKNRIYTVTVKRQVDCSGNEIGSANTARVGLASLAVLNDVVINEILFDPGVGGLDYVELYNRSSAIIDVKELYLANRAGSGTLGSLRQLIMESRLLFPGDYLVVTENTFIIKQFYTIKNEGAFVELSAMPSFPDDKGHAVLLNSGGLVIDELNYNEKWHFKLINNRQGVSLERIDFNAIANDQMNWHSAATSAGYGTPGYQNSQFMEEKLAEGFISIDPEIFSPDNDGFNDFSTINYRFPAPGYVCNLTVFDANGRPVRYLVKNAICGLTGYFRWDGLDEKSNRINTGIYVILTNVFTLKGKTEKYKNVIVLGRR